MEFTEANRQGHRVRVEGIVTLQRPGGSIFITDASGGLSIQTEEQTQLEPGDRVDVFGFPERGELTAVLLGATMQKLSSGAPLDPALITAEEAISGNYHSQLVSIEAYLLDRKVSSTGQALTLQAGKYTLRTNMQLITSAQPSAVARRFIAFTRTPQAQQLIRENGGVPISAQSAAVQ